MLPFPTLEDLPNPGIEPESPALAGEFFITSQQGRPVSKLPQFKKLCDDVNSTVIITKEVGAVRICIWRDLVGVREDFRKKVMAHLANLGVS